MSCSAEISYFVGDYGDCIKFVMRENDPNDPAAVCCDADPFDISTATVLNVMFQKPDGTVITRTNPTVSFVTDGTDGAFQYVVEQNLRDQSGQWQVQGSAIGPDFQRTTPVHCFTVNSVLGNT